MSDIFPSLPEPITMKDLFQAFPNTIPALCDYHDRLLRDWSPLTVGERELIAAYVSGLNACTFCHGAHNSKLVELWEVGKAATKASQQAAKQENSCLALTRCIGCGCSSV